MAIVQYEKEEENMSKKGLEPSTPSIPRNYDATKPAKRQTPGRTIPIIGKRTTKTKELGMRTKDEPRKNGSV